MPSFRIVPRMFAISLRGWIALAVVLAASAGAAGLRWRGSVASSGGLSMGAAFVDSLERRTGSVELSRDVAFGEAVSLGYVERLRLGLGSPFRLASHALRDPRLDTTARRSVAWAVIGRALRGEAYVIDPGALVAVGPKHAVEDSGAELRRAAHHLAIIEAAIAREPEPRVGELAVRLAYALAAAERTVHAAAPAVIAPVAALVRDRNASMGDARRLLTAARRQAVDPLTLLASWRRDRRFAVERPAGESAGEAVEARAIARVPSLLDSIRAAAAPIVTDSDSASLAGRARSVPPAPVLRSVVAARLAGGVAQYAPPQTPIVTVVRQHAPGLGAGPSSPEQLAWRREFAERAVNEEALAAEFARLAERDRGAPSAARLIVAAAAALRPYAQETPWFPGDPAPTEEELRREFGVTSVRFDAGVPARWRPYYRRMLADGLRDLRRVLPGVSLAGARVHFRAGGLGGATLAMHDPRTRTIHLPIATSAGALAHEVAHDLDWQMGRRRFGRRGSYGTDVVVREQRGRLAESLRGLTSARLIPPDGAGGTRPPDEVRPAEVFARTLDWFVSVALAREGRMNGYLSAVQDELLAGHVAVLPRDVGGWSAQALAAVLEETTLVGAPLREWLVAQWGPGRVRRPFTLAREVIATPVVRRPEPASSAVARLDVDACARRAVRETPSRVGLAHLAAEARARGMLRARAERYALDARPAWAESILQNGPWSPTLADEAVQRLAASILSRMHQSGEMAAALDWGDAHLAPGREDAEEAHDARRACG